MRAGVSDLPIVLQAEYLGGVAAVARQWGANYFLFRMVPGTKPVEFHP